jgi:hypothetical protein
VTVTLQLDAIPPEIAFWGEGYQDLGHSGRGWTYYSRLGLCPRRFYLAEIEGIRKRRATARDVGSFSHWAKQVYYDAQMTDQGVKAALDGFSRIRKNCASHHANVAAAETMFLSWIDATRSFDIENYKCLGTEVPLKYELGDFEYTARLDCVLMHKRSKAIYVKEFKHWSKTDTYKIMRLPLGGQYLGELFLARQEWGDKAMAVLVDISINKKEPDHFNEPVADDDEGLDRYMSMVKCLWACRGIYESMGWPEWRWSCGYGYAESPGQGCDYTSICMQGKKIDWENLPDGLEYTPINVSNDSVKLGLVAPF